MSSSSESAGEPLSRTTTTTDGIVRLYVRAPRGTRRSLELLRLDTWGESLLSTHVRSEIEKCYYILLAVFLFEVFAWSLLFNYILHGAEMTVTFATIAAVSLGILWGLGVFTIDKGIITADTHRPGAGKYISFTARAAVVMGAALLTAQPIEQLVFRTLVEEHLKQEIVREEAIAYAWRHDELSRARRSLDERSPETEIPEWVRAEVKQKAEDLAMLDAKVTAAMAEEERAKLAAERAAEIRRRALALAQRAPPGSDDAEIAKRRAAVAHSAARQAEYELDRASAERSASVGERERIAAALVLAKKERMTAFEATGQKLDNEQSKLEAIKAQYQRFFARLRVAAYGDSVTREDGEPFRWKAVGAVERMRALAQLRDGTPPRWPTARVEILRSASEIAGLGDDFSRTGTAAPEIGTLWLVVFLVGAAIPSLSILYKLTMSQELKLYYSVQAQARAGNAEAIALVRAREAVAELRGKQPSGLGWLAQRCADLQLRRP